MPANPSSDGHGDDGEEVVNWLRQFWRPLTNLELFAKELWKPLELAQPSLVTLDRLWVPRELLWRRLASL